GKPRSRLSLRKAQDRLCHHRRFLSVPSFVACCYECRLIAFGQGGIQALRDVAKARGGVAAVARETGLNRVALWRSFSAEGNPELGSLNRILEATGFRPVIASAKKTASRRRTAPRVRTMARKPAF